MSFDQFGGSIRHVPRPAAYENALTVLPDDQLDLPVIPSAILIPAWHEGFPNLTMNHSPAAFGRLTLQGNNNQPFEIELPMWNELRMLPPWILPFRARRIMQNYTTVQAVTLLW